MQVPPPDRDGSLWPRLALAALLVFAVVAFYALGLNQYLAWESIRANLDLWQEQVRLNLPLALLVFFLVYVAVTGLSLPVGALLSLVSGALFGRWLGTGVVSLASTLGATLAFLSSRYLFRDWVQQRFGAQLTSINNGVDRDGAYYLFTLRLAPVVPFFLINLGMGLTPMRVSTFAAVSWAGMLLGTFLYVNVGRELATLDSPQDLLSVPLLAALTLLGVVPLLLRKLVQWQVRWRSVALVLGGLLLVGVAGFAVRTFLRYQVADTMDLPLREFSNAEYPEDPANRSVHHGKYNGRRLRLIQKDATHFDFVLSSIHPHVAEIIFREVEVSLMTPSLPEWTKADAGLTRIALTDRQWNRQEVRFGDSAATRVEVTGGDGWEKEHLVEAKLAKNCLNAGLWEVMLVTKEAGEKALYYQGWFTFPLGHYKALFEQNTGLPYRQHWYYLEHWFDPAGTPVNLAAVREVMSERKVKATFDRSEKVLVGGEQARKRRTTLAENVVRWEDFYDGRAIRFATFAPPGRYFVSKPWKNQYRQIDRLDGVMLREVRSPGSEKPLHELELNFSGSRSAEVYRFFVTGFDLNQLPRLDVANYAQGMYMPMGIGVPPFFQSYEELVKNPPQQSAYVSVLLDREGRWVDHHRFAIDGPVLHRDAKHPDVLHLYLLSYERHSLIAHVVIRMRD